MKKSFLSVLVSLVFVSSASYAATNRIIVSVEAPAYNGAKGVQSVQSLQQTVDAEQCLSLPSGGSWCVPVIAAPDRSQVIASASSQKSLKAAQGLLVESRVINVPAELTEDQAIAMLKATGIYSYVEKNHVVTSHSWNQTTPDDPEFAFQDIMKTRQSDFGLTSIRSSIFDMWKLVKNPELEMDVYVIDSSFYEVDDVKFGAGANTVVVSFDNERNADYLEVNNRPDCTKSHGLSVASIIGAEINNAVGIAGIAGNVNLRPIRALDCGNGFLTDVSYALNWMAGLSSNDKAASPNMPAFVGKPGVINMSIGSAFSCPSYMQSAINRVVAAGYVVVASAGNESMEATLSTPANCENVISVGAMQYNSTLGESDLTSFSNFGKGVDVSALGVNVSAIAKENRISLFSGTSAAAPVVSGMLAILLKDFDLTQSEAELLVSISGFDEGAAEGTICAEKGCGSGVLDGVKLYNNAVKLKDGSLNTMSLAINAYPSCYQEFAVKHFSDEESLCDKATVDLSALGVAVRKGPAKLYTAEKGTLITGAEDLGLLTEVGSFDSIRFTTSAKTFVGRDVYTMVCEESTGECTKLYPVDTTALDDAPAICK